MDEYTKICMKEFTSRSNLEHVVLMSNASQDVRCDAAEELAALRARLDAAEEIISMTNAATNRDEIESVQSLAYEYVNKYKVEV